MSRNWYRAGKVLLFVVIILAGWGIYRMLAHGRRHPQRQPRHKLAAVVEVVPARAAQRPLRVTGMGTVLPARTVAVTPEVSGRLVFVSASLVPGGRVRRGQVLARIDPRDYELQVKQRQAQVVQAKAALARERGLKSVAEREWRLLGREVQPTAEGRRLALHEVQLESAQAALASAQAALEQARLMLEKTSLRAPFNAVVTEKLVDRGQVVGPATRIATLVSSDAFWVRVAVPLDKLSALEIPGRGGSTVGSPAEIVLQVGELRARRRGRVLQLLGDLDPRGKTARLLIEVNDPLGEPEGDGRQVPLLLGSYVAVHIDGQVIEGAVAVPRKALRENDRLWVKSPAGKLEVRQVKLLWASDREAFVSGEVRAGEQVIVSRIATPIPGMPVRTGDEEPAPEAGEKKPRPVADGDGRS